MNLIGLTYGPLAFESMVSAFTRLFWLNSMRPLKPAYPATTGRYAPLSELPAVLAARSPQERQALRQWLSLGAEERKFYAWGAKSGLIADNIRFCPICLEACYHSYFFQWLPISICPLHGCELISRCVQCNAPTLALASRVSLGRRPYLCARCKGPIADMAPNLEIYFDLQVTPTILEYGMRPALMQWRRTTRYLQVLAQIAPEMRLKTNRDFFPWCNGAAFVRAIEELLHKMDFPLGASHHNGVTLLSWRCRRSLDGQARCAPDHECPQRCAGATFDPARVYRATRRQLGLWIEVDEYPHCADEALSHVYWNKCRRSLREYNAYCAAFALFRRVCEEGDLPPFTTELVNFNASVLCKVTDTPLGCMGSRVGYRALLCGLYAVLYASVLANPSLTLFELCRMVDISGVRLAAANLSEPQVTAGAVFFPTVPGMVLDPFTRRADVAISWESALEDIDEAERSKFLGNINTPMWRWLDQMLPVWRSRDIPWLGWRVPPDSERSQ